MIQFYFWTEMA